MQMKFISWRATDTQPCLKNIYALDQITQFFCFVFSRLSMIIIAAPFEQANDLT